MKCWNKTVFVWGDMHSGTDIPISNWWEKDKTVHHTIANIRIVSQLDKSGSVHVTFLGCGSPPCREDSEIMNDRLNRLVKIGVLKSILPVTCSGRFEGVFVLKNGKCFTDQAIEVAQSILESFGVSKTAQAESLARFHLHQETLVHHGGEWICFSRFLRIRHKLPLILGTGWDR